VKGDEMRRPSVSNRRGSRRSSRLGLPNGTTPWSGSKPGDEEDLILFQEVLNEALKTPEIVDATRRAVGVDAEYLGKMAERSRQTLWPSADKERQLVLLLKKELQQRRLRLRDPILRILYELNTAPELRGILAIAGILSIAVSFGSNLSRSGMASGWNRVLFYTGIAILFLALVRRINRYAKVKMRRLVRSRARRVWAAFTGSAMILLAIIRSNHLSQFRWANWLLPIAILVVDGIVLINSVDSEESKEEESKEEESRGKTEKPSTGVE
jgi:hypothetical protein